MTPRLRKILVVASVVAGALLAVAAGFLIWLQVFLRASLPERSGAVKVPGLEREAVVIFDEWGVPDVYAESEEDLVYAMGYVHASDRLFQMDLSRRLPSGRLAELFGPDLIEVDAFFRTVGMHRTARKVVESQRPGLKRLLESYARGVNDYVEKPDPDDPSRYVYDGKTRPFEIVEELVRYREAGEMKEHVLQVRLSVHGPVLNDVVPEFKDADVPPLALRWTGNDHELYDLGALRDMARAETWEEFLKALRGLGFLEQNWSFADASGNIAFIAGGGVPRRAPGHDGTLPVPGWTSKYEWNGCIPQAELPQLINPGEGFIVTANNSRVPVDDYPYAFSYYYVLPYRAARIRSLVKEAVSGSRVSEDDTRRIQMDVFSPKAERVAPIMATAARESSEASDPRFSKAVELLESWDFAVDADDAASCVFHAAYRHAFRMTYEVESATLVVPPGQSGQLKSRHYGDQAAQWLTGKSHAMPMARAEAEKAAASILVLSPE